MFNEILNLLLLLELKYFTYCFFRHLFWEKALSAYLWFFIWWKCYFLGYCQFLTGITVKDVIPFFEFQIFLSLWFMVNCSFLQLLFCVVDLFGGTGDCIELRNHDCALRDRSELSPHQLIYKMAENVIVLLLAFGLLDRKLQLAHHFPHK